MSLIIGGVTVKTPTEMPIEKYNLTKSGRVASGKMTMELVAQKRKLNCKYNTIREDDLQVILGKIYDPANLFFSVTFDDAGGQTTITAYAGAIKGYPFRRDTDNVWLWKDVEFALVEQ
ncbi:MAG: hypothetical protein A4E53_02142 [Pelotomaculum sp. PtaB.Bin104]|nr:MAG: hypothetical protein A4E53_02142 [Pelotomaculum sp. PtaB.Bin104]